MIDKDYYAAADRIQIIDERLAYDMMKRNYPNYKNSRSEFDFWKGYSEVATKDNIDYYVPFSFLMKYSENEGKLKYNYALIRLVDYLTDIEQPVYLGLDFSYFTQFEADLIKTAEFLTLDSDMIQSIMEIFKQGYIMRIKYRKDLRNNKIVLISRENEQLKAKVLNEIVSISDFRCELSVNEFLIPHELSRQAIDCLNSSFRNFVLDTTIGEDDRCYMDNAFSIYVPEENLSLPETEWGYSPYEYFYSGEKSAFAPFNKLMSFIYDHMTDSERDLFPFK